MRKLISGISLLLLAVNGIAGAYKQDSLTENFKRQPFLGLKLNYGVVLPTNDFISNTNKRPTFSSASLRYGFSATGSRWQDYAYGMPYAGIGIMASEFFDKHSLGNPYTLYAFQGISLGHLSKRVKLNFEWNLGASFNWKPYDPFDNPDNIALGSSSNVYVGLNIFADINLTDYWDLQCGLGVSHYSNGASRLPNKGLNMVSSFMELTYNFNRGNVKRDLTAEIRPPRIEPRIDYELLVNISSRQRRFDTTGTNLPSQYIDKNFSVYGMTFAPMIVTNFKFKYGAGVDLLYDESSGAKAWRELNPHDGKLYDRVKLGSFGGRFSLGVSAKGEITLPMYSIFANMGCNIIQGNKQDKRIYQVIGVKAYLKENLFGTFGIRAANFSQAQYLYWSLGYTFKGKPLSQVKRELPLKLSRR